MSRVAQAISHQLTQEALELHVLRPGHSRAQWNPTGGPGGPTPHRDSQWRAVASGAPTTKGV